MLQNNNIGKNTLYGWLCLPQNRLIYIKKIEKGLKKVEIETDKEIEEFTYGFLKNWSKLEEFEPVKNDLGNLRGNARKLKIKEIKLEFCSWLLENSNLGQEFANNKKYEIDLAIHKTKGNIKKKIKAGVDKLTGETKRFGRNDPCVCGSELKYKNCCGKP